MAQFVVVLLVHLALQVAAQIEPAEFKALPLASQAASAGAQFKDSPHFRVYGVDDSKAAAALNHLEASYSCFTKELGWRSSGLSYNPGSDNGPYYKVNVYGVASAGGGAAGVMGSDRASGMSYLRVGKAYVDQPGVTVHEYGHGMTYHERTWVDQTRTGAWWETVAQFVADTYMTSPLCEPARKKNSIPEGRSLINLPVVLGRSYSVIVDGSQGTGNYYDAWPFLSYLTYNPDKYEGLGAYATRDMFRKYKKGSNETPLHALEHVLAGAKVQKVVGRYWARMAYADIGHKGISRALQAAQTGQRTQGWYANLDPAGGAGMYRVKASRQPKYMGANIMPLKGSGQIAVKVTATDAFTATLAVKSKTGPVKYVDLVGGTGNATVNAGEEASLIVVNTPETLILYDGFKIPGSGAAKGLDYQVAITGATV